MSAIEDDNSIESGYTLSEQLCIIDKQIISSVVLIYVAFLSIISLYNVKSILYLSNKQFSINIYQKNKNINNSIDNKSTYKSIIYEKNAKNNIIKKIQSQNEYINKFNIVTVIIIAFFYLFQSISDYEKEKSKVNLYNIDANFFTVIANLIRLVNIFVLVQNKDKGV